MKKFFAVFLVMILLATTAYAAGGEFADAASLYEHWCETCGEDRYPDGVSGFWSVDGTMDNVCIGLADTKEGHTLESEICDSVADTSGLTFQYMKYSYRQLREAQEEIAPLLGEDSGAWGCGIYEMENYVGVDIDTDADGAKEFMSSCAKKYGDMVKFTDGDVVTLEEATLDYTGGKSGIFADHVAIFAVTAFALLLIAGGFFVLLRRRRAAVTDTGDIHSEDMTLAEVEEIARSSAMTPSKSVDEKIFSSFDGE